MADVEAARQTLGAAGSDDMEGYKLTVLGGLAGKPNTMVSQMVDLFAMRRSRSFEFNVCFQPGAKVLVKAWVERVECLAQLWVEAGTPLSGWKPPKQKAPSPEHWPAG